MMGAALAVWKAQRGLGTGGYLNPALAFRLEQPRRADVILGAQVPSRYLPVRSQPRACGGSFARLASRPMSAMVDRVKNGS